MTALTGRRLCVSLDAPTGLSREERIFVAGEEDYYDSAGGAPQRPL